MTHAEATLQTKAALAQSLKKFMLKKPLGKITVSEIIADCNVNRKTFYYHFEDIYALVKWMLEQEAIEVVKGFDLLIDYEDAIRFVMNYVRDNAHILNCAYDSMGRDELKRFFYNDFASIGEHIIEDTEKQSGFFVSEASRAFLCEFFTEAIAGMLVNSIRDPQRIEAPDLIHNVAVLLDSLPDILRRMSQPS